MRLRRRLTGLLLSAALLTGSVPAVHADTVPLRLYVNGHELYMPVPPVMQNNRVLVPMRFYLEALGAEVTWQAPDTAIAKLQGRTVQMQIGSTAAYVDGEAVSLDVPAQLIEDRTYLPVRFLSEGLGAQVGYDAPAVLVNTDGRQRLQVIDGPLNVRQSPTTASGILTTVPNGTILNVVSQGVGWTQVSLPRGHNGWVASQYTRIVTAQTPVAPVGQALSRGEAFLQIGERCFGVAPVLNNQLQVPLRQAIAGLGGSVTLQQPDVEVRLSGKTLILTPGEQEATLDGEPITLSPAPITVGGQVLIAARTLADALTIPLGWNDALRTASLGTDKPGAVCNPTTTARSYIVMDAATGVVLSESHSRDRFPIASTTKVMTGLLAVEMGDPESIVTVSRNADNQPGTSVYLLTGEQRKLKELLYGLMLVSGNDAATAIAEHLAGSEPAFAQLMNRRAYELGATNTYFFNASGLDDYVNPYSTARDLATIARYAIQNPEFRIYMSKASASIPGPSGTRYLKNLNEFTVKSPGATGVKNGWTEKALYTLVASAYRNGRELLVVILGAPNKTSLYQQANLLMDHGFRIADQSWLLEAER